MAFKPFCCGYPTPARQAGVQNTVQATIFGAILKKRSAVIIFTGLLAGEDVVHVALHGVVRQVADERNVRGLVRHGELASNTIRSVGE